MKKNAISVANLVLFLDRRGNGGGMKKIGRTVLFLSIWTSAEPQTSLGAVIPPNPQVNSGGNLQIIISDKPTKSFCFLQFKFVLQHETTGTIDNYRDKIPTGRYLLLLWNENVWFPRLMQNKSYCCTLLSTSCYKRTKPPSKRYEGKPAKEHQKGERACKQEN